MRLTEQEQKELKSLLKDLLQDGGVREMARYPQHGSVTTLDHCLAVAKTSFWLARRLRLSVDERSLARGALLHDFFLYDWHEKSGRKGLHAFTHPRAALENARQRFSLNSREREIILKHMWALTVTPPVYKEAYLVCLADKLCCLRETLLCRKPPKTDLSSGLRRPFG